MTKKEQFGWLSAVLVLLGILVFGLFLAIRFSGPLARECREKGGDFSLPNICVVPKIRTDLNELEQRIEEIERRLGNENE